MLSPVFPPCKITRSRKGQQGRLDSGSCQDKRQSSRVSKKRSSAGSNRPPGRSSRAANPSNLKPAIPATEPSVSAQLPPGPLVAPVLHLLSRVPQFHKRVSFSRNLHVTWSSLSLCYRAPRISTYTRFPNYFRHLRRAYISEADILFSSRSFLLPAPRIRIAWPITELSSPFSLPPRIRHNKIPPQLT